MAAPEIETSLYFKVKFNNKDDVRLGKNMTPYWDGQEGSFKILTEDETMKDIENNQLKEEHMVVLSNSCPEVVTWFVDEDGSIFAYVCISMHAINEVLHSEYVWRKMEEERRELDAWIP